jgi:hypothetical protein
VSLADHFCKFISRQRAEQERLAAAALIKHPDAISTEVRIKPVPKHSDQNLTQRHNNSKSEGGNSFRLVIPDMAKRGLLSAAAAAAVDRTSSSSVNELDAAGNSNVNNRRKSSQREATFSLSQSVSIVAPWLHKARHTGFEEFLQSRINL